MLHLITFIFIQIFPYILAIIWLDNASHRDQEGLSNALIFCLLVIVSV